MAINDLKITDSEIKKNNVGSAPDDMTGHSAAEVKAVFDKLPTLHIGRFNSLIETLSSNSGASNIGTMTGVSIESLFAQTVKSNDIKKLRINADEQLEVSEDGQNYHTVGSSGHIIVDENSEVLPERTKLKFAGGVSVEDDPENNATLVTAYYTDEQLRKVQVYTATHTKSGTVHTLSGIPTLSGLFTVQFKATADYTSGNTFAGHSIQVIGKGTTLADGYFLSGDVVSILIDTNNNVLYFPNNDFAPSGFGLGTVSVPLSKDLNPLLAFGCWRFDNNTTNRPSDANYGMGVTVPYGNGWAKQIAFDAYSDIMYLRSYQESEFSPWVAYGHMSLSGTTLNITL